jgi:hypothetical protein
MSSDHSKTMLRTLMEYADSEISLVFNDQNRLPLLSVCYKNFCFEVTNLKNSVINTYDDIEKAILFIENQLKPELQEISN